jgi:hypothetical protein
MASRNRLPDKRRPWWPIVLGVLTVASTTVAVASGAGPVAASTVRSAAPTVLDAAGTTWLCQPGTADDPCESPEGATVVSASGASTPQPAPAVAPSPVDCFYVYPTVSRQTTDNANLKVQAVELEAAFSQASRFSSVCNVWSPVYRQRTAVSLEKGLGNDPAADAVAYQSVLSAWKDYLANDNDGRPVAFIGHSQGAAMLIRLLRSQVDTDPSVRARLVAAIILGGNVEVPIGRTVGGSFAHIPACTAATQTGCVIAYSSFPSRPPADSEFGRPGQGVSLQSGQRATKGLAVLCVNPASLRGRIGTLDPYFVATTGGTAAAPWVTYPGLYTARCRQGGGASWLEVKTASAGHDVRPTVSETLGPAWGYHPDDVNLALGNLVADVGTEITAFEAAHPTS